jgi:hypothetical protein
MAQGVGPEFKPPVPQKKKKKKVALAVLEHLCQTSQSLQQDHI